MKGLLLRLSSLDADAAAAFRVIAHFQALLGGGVVEPVVLVRSTAGLAQCPAGLELPDGRRVRFGPDGVALAGAPGRTSGEVGTRSGGRVWLERKAAAGPFDALVLEWMAIAAEVGTQAGGPGRTGPSPQAADPALVELVLSEREAIEDRTRALRLLGLHPERPLRVVAVAGVDPGPAAGAGSDAGSGSDVGANAGVEAVTLMARSGQAAATRVAAVGALAAALVQSPAPLPGEGPPGKEPDRPPCGGGTDGLAAELRAVVTERVREHLPGGDRPYPRQIRFCVGVGGSVPPDRACVSWAQARTALRFAAAGGPAEVAAGEAVVDHDELGPLTLLAEVPPERLRSEPGVRALAELAARDGGELSIAALAAFCRTGSLRQAAAALHLHHSSVAARLAGVETALGWRLTEPPDRLRAHMALYAWRLSAAGGA
ncbi:PucR family transcriptional regulator [Streptomyces sp. 4N509B]|uniref:PucR family transcriptional regulator n=1 Tax=Streptomyces sp. 4N509B TaxID=3457413 RepID=UPI003FD4251C